MKSSTSRIGIIDFYDSASPVYRDPIQIPMSLRAAGFDVELVTRCEGVYDKIHGFPVSKVSELFDTNRITDKFECFIAISRFDPVLSPVLEKIKAHGIPLIIKGDTDGTLGFPMVPNYLRTVPLMKGRFNFLRHLKWRLPLKRFFEKKLKQFEYADRVVYESPGAGVNLTYVLKYWGMERHIDKMAWIPNSVHKSYIDGDVQEKAGLKIVAIGRWDDVLVKGGDILARVISDRLMSSDEISFSVVGSGGEYIRRKIPKAVAERVDFKGQLNTADLKEVLVESKIIIVPSRLESFSISSAEALCSGCSLVATPIESLFYLSGGGAFGSISKDFTPESLSAALDHEIQQWKDGIRQASKISSYWRSELNEETIGRKWVNLVNNLLMS